MKPFFFLIIVFVLAGTEVYAKKIPGTIIRKGKTEEVIFSVRIPLLASEPSFEGLQYRIKYFDKSGKKHILMPADADEIRFEYDGIQVRMISIPKMVPTGFNFSTRRGIFLKLEMDGPLRLFRYYYKQTSGSTMGPGGGFSPGITYTADNLIFQKGNGPLVPARMRKKDLMEYFNDCPSLVGLLEAKDLKRRDVEAIVMFYNRNCAK